MNTLAFGPIGTPELIILGFIGLLIFGKRLPEIFNGLGSSIRTFKEGLTGVSEDIARSGEDAVTASPAACAQLQSEKSCEVDSGKNAAT
jgi:sec-independent protein translocase protein TatA